MNTYLDGEGGVFMEKSYTKIYTTGATVPLKIRPGHFATNHAHINYYIDVTTLKARTKEAEEVAQALVGMYLYDTVIDTIVCMEGTEVIGAFLAEELAKGGFLSTNAHKSIYVISPEFNNNSQIIFQYESVLGQTISIPAVYVDKINLLNGNQITPNEPVNQPAKQPVEKPAEQPAEQPAPPATKPAAQPTTPASNVSAGESNALKSAKSYLDMGGFSKESLKGQLEYEGYDANQIQYALDNCGADWKKQALMSAKSYLGSNMGFSKLGLTEQLEYEEFTSDEVQYAIDNCGGDWMAQAVIKAQSYMESVPMSRDELISQRIK